MAGVAFVLCSLAITFDPNVEADEEKMVSKKRKRRKTPLERKKMTLLSVERASCYCHYPWRMCSGMGTFCATDSLGK